VQLERFTHAEGILEGVGAFDAWEAAFVGPMTEYPRVEHTLRDIRRAGETIAGDLQWNRDSEAGIREAFHIANNWREGHAFPMRSIRGSLRWYMHSRDIAGVAVARLKRMHAIRRKLQRIGLKLNQIQDLGGCRAIVPSIADVVALTECMKNGRHELRHEDPYIDGPKKSGYRSHHMIFNFCGRGDRKIYDGKRIEVQIRTRLQHSWATAVESVGLFLGEYLKGSQGSEDWLRLFLLMSAEFARLENCQEPPDVPAHEQRIKEIIELDERLGAVKNLDKLSHAVRFTDIAVSPIVKPTYYLIRYDNLTNQVSVEPYFVPKSATASYGSAEFLENIRFGKEKETIVLVEADKLDSLKEAYPNYFGDVQLFRLQLRNIVKGVGVKEYDLKPQDRAPIRPKLGENADITWLRRRHRWTERTAVGKIRR
jgi:hypothetical protein